ncbi:26S proteasome non-ATPase regulatory subunit 5 [Phymastichus coffea]|uniref:26S proteasome non-ATPase regulatory subunit 5 n=1 Tax=Phymastichus coffea TaxID=108790 RepID=UPI00273C7AE1|nr:26S proteasome non-ATPase regulatory subunit 5 [Phymastichus coffea]
MSCASFSLTCSYSLLYTQSEFKVIESSSRMADWIAMKLNHFSDLYNVQQREEVLTEIKIKFANLDPDEAVEITRNLDLARLLCQLIAIDKDFREQLCDALTVLFKAAEPGQFLHRYTRELRELLTHREAALKILALQEIDRVASHPNSLPLLLTKLYLLLHVIQTVADNNLDVAKHSMDILKKIGRNPDGLKTLYEGELLRTIAKLLKTNDVVTFRVYEVIVDIANHSKECLEASIKSGFLQSLIDKLENDDILLQLNALETLTSLALHQEGLNYLEQHGVLQQLSQKIAQAHETPLSSLLIPGLMKFFGNVAQLCPNDIFSRYPPVISALFEVIESNDQTLLAIALDTLGYISTTVKGKYALQDLGYPMLNALKKIGDVIQKMPSELRVRGLNNLTVILSVPKAEQDNRILSLTKSWFDEICEKPLEIISSLCRQPFADIRQASLEVLAVIGAQEWGQEYIANHPGLVEFLLDRNVESFKECKEAKFEVVKNLSDSVPNIFDATTMQRIKKFVSEGPFFVETITEIAIEGAS